MSVNLSTLDGSKRYGIYIYTNQTVNISYNYFVSLTRKSFFSKSSFRAVSSHKVENAVGKIFYSL